MHRLRCSNSETTGEKEHLLKSVPKHQYHQFIHCLGARAQKLFVYAVESIVNES